jgi:hypothetical protein
MAIRPFLRATRPNTIVRLTPPIRQKSISPLAFQTSSRRAPHAIGAHAGSGIVTHSSDVVATASVEKEHCQSGLLFVVACGVWLDVGETCSYRRLSGKPPAGPLDRF